MGPEGAIGPDSERNRKVTKRILGALGIKNLRKEGKAMDMDHAKIQVEVRRVAGKQGEASVAIEGPKNLLLKGLAMLIRRLAKERHPDVGGDEGAFVALREQYQACLTALEGAGEV